MYWGVAGKLTRGAALGPAVKEAEARFHALLAQLQPGKELSPELFFSARNLFNGERYWDYWYKNAGRWLEGGVRFRF